MNKLSQVNACVIIPTYNNSGTLARVIDSVLPFGNGKDIFVVNDGSSDTTQSILEKYKNKIIVLTNESNRGKGFSLRRGFAEAIRQGFDSAITMDSDGQHFAEDIPSFLKEAALHKDTLIMGERNMDQEGIPGKSSFGNKFSNFWYWFETGITLKDTQTGFRLYPLKPLKELRLFTNKFETEIEVIVKLAWKGTRVISIPVKVIYFTTDRVTHFRPFKDFTRISFLNAWFVLLTILYYMPKRFLKKMFSKKFWQALWIEAKKPEESNFSKASSIGFGVFIGIAPIWGFQLLIGIPLALFMRMNKVLFITAANISIPPLIPLIIYASYLTGSMVVDNDLALQEVNTWNLEATHLHVKQYYLGAIILAIGAGFTAWFLSFLLFSIFRKKGE